MTKGVLQSTGTNPSPPSDAGPSPLGGDGGGWDLNRETLQLLEHFDAIYQKLSALSDSQDDETPQPVAFRGPECHLRI